MTRAKNQTYRNREHLTPDEVNELLYAAAATGRYGDRNRALVLLMYRHGLRAVEAAWLQWSDVDLKKRQIFIRRAKGSISGSHPLQNDEIEALQALDRVSGVPQVFTNERGKSFLVPARIANRAPSAPGISRTIERIGEAANIGIKVHAHMLRHGCGYYLANQGYDTRMIQDYLGHQNIQHTVRYTRLNADRFNQIQW